MLNGYVIWFGGKNNKLNEINDYGYIKYIDNGIARDIKFFRYDITEHEQFVLETKRHRKIKVAFALDSLNHKYPVAVNINLNSLIGTVVKIKDNSRIEISCEGYDNFDVFQSISKVNVGDVVLLTDSYDEELKDDEFILLKTINTSTQDYKIKAECTQSNDFNIFKLFIVDYLIDLPPESAIAFILQKMDKISEADRSKLIKYLTDKIPNIVITSTNLRALLSRSDRDRYISLILKQIDRVEQSLRQELVDEICHLLKDIDDVNEKDRAKLILWLYKEASNTVVMSAELRLLLMESSQVSYISLLGTYLGQVDSEVKEELLSEIFKNLTDTTDTEKNNYWKKIAYLKENVEYKGYLWNIATSEVKKELTTIKFKSFLRIFAEFNKSEYPYEAAIFANWRQLHKFDNIDNQLIDSWTGKNTTSVLENKISPSKLKMMSARGAEKLAIQFYKELGYSVEDISSHQITESSQAWRLGDIRINSGRLLDVKNARISENTTSYSEFLVKQLKKESNKNVSIIAVLSPCLNEYEIESGTRGSSLKRDEKIEVLGEFSETDLENFRQLFEGNLISIDFSKGLDRNKYLPHWLFDYCNKFYEDQIDIISRFRLLRGNEIPDVDDCSILDLKLIKYLPLFIASGRPLPISWTENILDWQKKFAENLIELKQSRISLPLIFLSLLTHFLSMLSSKQFNSDYSPSKYKEILYSDGINKYPLKIYDPLGTINDFCDSLQSIWDYRGQAKLDTFKVFKFDGRGLLSGKRSSQDRDEIKLLAYCGGKKKNKTPCGCKPLVIGKHETCLSCNRLICKKCDYCWDSCAEYKSRIEIKTLNQKKIPDPIRKVTDRS